MKPGFQKIMRTDYHTTTDYFIETRTKKSTYLALLDEQDNPKK